VTTPKGRFGNLPLDPVEMLAHVDEYLLELEATLHARDYVRITRVALTHFSAFCRREGIDHPTRIQRGDLLRFQHFLSQNPNWSVSYKRQLLKYARAYINWMEAMGYLEENPWVKIRVGRTVKQPKPLEDEELDALFAAHKKQAFSQDPFYYHRRELMLAVLYGWGLRLHEACALNMQDMDLRRDFVTAINKGGGTKSLPYIEEIKKSFQRWVRWRNTKACVDDALFVNTDGSRMNPDQMRKVLVTLAGSAGVAVNPHRLRDTAATNMLDQGMSVERVQRILGHKNIAQTLAYTEVRDKTLAEEHSKAMNPKLKILFNNTRKLRRGKPAPE
jgi:site-specific recombinase XerD